MEMISNILDKNKKLDIEMRKYLKKYFVQNFNIHISNENNELPNNVSESNTNIRNNSRKNQQKIL